MTIYRETDIRTQKELSLFLNTLVESGVETQQVSRETCWAIKTILEEEAAQKAAQAHEIAELEKKNAQTDQSYRKIIFFLAAFIDKNGFREADRQAMALPVKQFRALLGTKSSLPLIEQGFEQLKTALLSETRDNSKKNDRARLLGLMGQWLNTPGEDNFLEDKYLSLFIHSKEIYLEVAGELKKVLSSGYRENICLLETRTNQAQTVKEFNQLRSHMLNLLQEYIAESSNDKAQAVFFAEEISRRILDMDKKIFSSLESFQKNHAMNQDFNTKLESNIQELKAAVTIGSPIKELSHTINEKIELISQTLHQKKIQDFITGKKIEKRIATLKSGMKKVRDGFNEIREKNHLLKNEVNTDYLTGVASKKAYEFCITKEMERFLRYKRTFSLIVFDIDHFKTINDTHGHIIGDQCLREICVKIKPVLRNTDILARIGGDEFVILLSETESQEARIVGEKLRQLVEKTEFIYKEQTIPITLSLGITHAMAADMDYETVFKRADTALYKAKQSGRNQMVAMM